MDCHETDTTTWKLMGVFKEASFFGGDAFFEQLFKHEGICVWNNANQYSFMQTARQNYWPNGCTSTGIQIKNSYSNSYGKYLYLDLRPTWNGNMTYGLYSDEICKTEYDLPDMNVDTITKNLGLLYGSTLQQWNNGLEAFKVCQPCKAYNIRNTKTSSSSYGSYSDSSDPNGGYFQCNDDAGYTNVNQCMKFRSHAKLEVCTWEDLVTATNQGGILQVKVGDTVFGSEKMSKEEYQSLMTSQKETNLKWSKAEKQTVLLYRAEAEKVEAMKPAAERWSSLGGTSIAIGAIALLGSVLLIAKRHIDRIFPSKAFSEPLLPPSREFLGKELKNGDDVEGMNQGGGVNPGIPFGDGSDDGDGSDIQKAGTVDDNTSVSSLSYVSTAPSASPDPVNSPTSAVDTDAIASWYKNVKKIDSLESWTSPEVDDESKIADDFTDIAIDDSVTQDDAKAVVIETEESSDVVVDDFSDIFDGLDPSPDSPSIESPTNNILSSEAQGENDEVGLPLVVDDVDTKLVSLTGEVVEPQGDMSPVSDHKEEAEKVTDEMSTESVAFIGDLQAEKFIDETSTESVAFIGDLPEPQETVPQIDDHIDQTENEAAMIDDDVRINEDGGKLEASDEIGKVEAKVVSVTPETSIDTKVGEVPSQDETMITSNVSPLENKEHDVATMEYPDEMDQHLSASEESEAEGVITANAAEEEISIDDTETVDAVVTTDPAQNDASTEQAQESTDVTVDDK
jgi:hypothetical protein